MGGMKHRFIICWMNPESYGSMITWRCTLKAAKLVADAYAKERKVGVWDNDTSEYVYTAG